MIKDVRIRAAGSENVEAISQVLRSCGLPDSDIDPSSRLYSLAVLGEKIIGCACGEMHGETVIVQAAAVLDLSSMATPQLRRRESLFLIEESAHQGVFDVFIL